MDIQTLEALVFGEQEPAAIASTFVPGSAQHFDVCVCVTEAAQERDYGDAGASAAAESKAESKDGDDAADMPKLRSAIATYVRDNPYSEDVEAYKLRATIAAATPGASDAVIKRVSSELEDKLGLSFTHEPDADSSRAPDALPSRISDTDSIAHTHTLVREALSSCSDTHFGELRLTSAVVDDPQVLAHMRADPRRLLYFLHATKRVHPDVANHIRIVSQYAATPDGERAGVSKSSVDSLVSALMPSMTLAQLHEVAGILPDLKSRSPDWIGEVLRRVAPDAQELETKPEVRSAYLEAVQREVGAVSDRYMALTHAVLYHRVRAALGSAAITTPDGRAALAAFAAIPRSGSVWAPVRPIGASVITLSPGSDATGVLRHFALPPPTCNDDDALLRVCLREVLLHDGARISDASTLAPWSDSLERNTIENVLARALLEQPGAPTAEVEAAATWIRSHEGVSALEALRTSVDIAFGDFNPVTFAPGDDVTLEFTAKGVPVVNVRVFEINTTAYYLDKGTEITSDIPLDGLSPNVSFDVTPGGAGNAFSPLLRHSEKLRLPTLNGFRRGVFVVELVAAGKSCRAIIRKGCLKTIEHRTAAGHELTLLDEQNVPIPAGVISVTAGGRKFTPVDTSSGALPRIVVPFAASTSRVPLLLTLTDPAASEADSPVLGWSFSTLIESWELAAESYNLEAAFHIQREALVADNYDAVLTVRPRLLLHGSMPAPLGALTNVVLTISARDADGKSSQIVARNFQLLNDQDSKYTFAVPPDLRQMDVSLSADVELVATGARQSLNVSRAVSINSIVDTGMTRAAILRVLPPGEYAVYVLGRNGEPASSLAVTATFYDHALVTSSRTRSMRTDEHGCVVLGALHGFRRVRITASNMEAAWFDLPVPVATLPTSIHVTDAGDAGASMPGKRVQARIPWMLQSARTRALERMDVSLVRVAERSAAPVRDYFGAEHITWEASTGLLAIHDLPAGKYALSLRRPAECSGAEHVISIVVVPAISSRFVLGHIAAGDTVLQTRAAPIASQPAHGLALAAVCPLHVADVQAGAEDVTVRVVGGAGGSGPASARDVRVHVFSSVLVGPWNAGAELGSISTPGLATMRTQYPRSRFMNGRQLGEEYQYVLRRQALASGDKLPGNLLPRPSLLLNPWSLGTVSTGIQHAAAGTEFARHADRAGVTRAAGGSSTAGAAASYESGSYARHQCLDFLVPGAAAAVLNLPLESDGVVRVPLSSLFGKAGRWKERCITVVAVDAVHTSAVTLAVQPAGADAAQWQLDLQPACRNLAGAQGVMHADEHVVPTANVSVLGAAGSHVDISAAASYTKVEVYGSLDRAFGLLSSLSNNAQLVADFNWMTMWPTLSQKDKQAKYSKYACHEMHVFLFFKDPGFFDAVVRPFLMCKRAKTFVDHWLLGHDMNAHMAPHAFERLNAFEKALLAARVDAEPANAIARRLREAVENSPTPASTREAIFKAALVSNALAGAEPTGDALKALLDRAQQERERERASRPAVPTAQAASVPAVARAMRLTGEIAMSARPAPAAVDAMMFELAKESGETASSARRSAMPLKKMAARGGAPRPVAAAPAMLFASRAPTSAMASMAPPPPPAPGGAVFAADMDMPCEEEGGFDGEVREQGIILADDSDGDDDVLARRQAVREQVGYRPLDKTEEFAESQYYRITSLQDTPALVPLHEYWADFAAFCASLGAAVRRAGITSASAFTATAVGNAYIKEHPFVSAHIGVIGHGKRFNEMLLGVAVLGLPWEASTELAPQRPDVQLHSETGRIRYTAGSTPAILFHRDLTPASPVATSPILIGQSYFDPSDRYTTVRGRQTEKFMTADPASSAVELLVGKVYGVHIVVTNVSSAAQTVDVLVHIPSGALAVQGGKALQAKALSIGAYATQSIEYQFYMPSQGSFSHYPPHVAIAGELHAFTSDVPLRVVAERTVVDTTSWSYVSQRGTVEDVLTYIATCNVYNTDMSRILWRCRDVASWRKIITALSARRVFDTGVWQYSVKHGDLERMRELLAHDTARQTLRSRLGRTPALNTYLMRIVPEMGVGASSHSVADDTAVNDDALGGYSDADAKAYEHLEYAPLINARAHQLGEKRIILNEAVARQYRALLVGLSRKSRSRITAQDWLAVAYHLLLQDRNAEARRVFAKAVAPSASVAVRVRGGEVASKLLLTASDADAASWLTLQYDYMAAYMDFFEGASALATGGGAYQYPVATAVAAAYKDWPVPRWANKFRELAAQLLDAGVVAPALGSTGVRSPAAAVDGSREAADAKEAQREATHSRAVAAEPSLTLTINKGVATFHYANTARAELRVYDMNLELLFSTSPFVVASAAAQGAGDDGGSPGAERGPRRLLSPATKDAVALGQFAYVRPNASVAVALPALPTGRTGEVTVPLPGDYARRNCMVEAVSLDGSSRSVAAHFATEMSVVVSEAFGRLKVTHTSTGAPLPQVYVKVYYRTTADDTKGKFYKDGYTDIRGAFDFTSLSTDELSKTQRFALLVMSDKHGACVRMARPPAGASTAAGV